MREEIRAMASGPRTPLLGAFGVLVSNLPVAMLSFTLVVVGATVGAGTALLWVGIPVGAATVAAWRWLAGFERRRMRVLLGVDIPAPYRLPDRGGWPARLRDPATWRDAAYHLSLLPLCTVQWGLLGALWSAGGWLTLLPVTVTWFPDWHPALWHLRLFNVDSWAEALPLAALGALALFASIPLARWLAVAHVRFAGRLLGPVPRPAPRVEPVTPVLVAG